MQICMGLLKVFKQDACLQVINFHSFQTGFCLYGINDNQYLVSDLPVTENNPFLAGQALQADRAADMDFIGGNADFRA